MSALARVTAPFAFGSRRAGRLMERNVLVYRRSYLTLASGFFEPLFYLLAMGFGLGVLVGTVPGPDGRPMSYTAFIAPALLAASCANGAVYEATNVMFRLNYEKVYHAVLATPLGVGDVALGELGWALTRGALYATGFTAVLLVLGLMPSLWGLLALPASLLIGRPHRGRHRAGNDLRRRVPAWAWAGGPGDRSAPARQAPAQVARR